MEDPSDGELLRRFRGGDASAIDELVQRHQAAQLRHARALLGEGRAFEDVVQETFLKLVRQTPRMPPEAEGDPALERAHLASWLHRVTRNACMDVIRSETRRRRREEHVAAHDQSDGGLPSVEGRDTREAVERGLALLPHDQREVLVLRLLGDRSYKEIAAITGKKVGTVGWLISVGLKALAVELEPLLGLSSAATLACHAEPARVGAFDGSAS